MYINQSNDLSTPSKHLMLASQKCPEMLVDSSRCPAGRTLGHFSLGLRPRATGVRGGTQALWACVHHLPRPKFASYIHFVLFSKPQNVAFVDC